MSEIYQPAEDSYLLAETLRNYLTNLKDTDKKLKILDMGAGSGIQAETSRSLGFKNILTADINPEVVKHLKKVGFKSIQTDLFSKLYKRKGDLSGETLVPIQFDLILFNPPYLPEDRREPKDSKLVTTAGEKGHELIIKFLDQAKTHLTKKGVILLLISSLSKPRVVKKRIKELKYNMEHLNQQKLFFEELYVYLLRS